ncbi:hypothetical protein S7335_2648 [Synechococcus sp. PCC 7335]|nr:hypothetical protein S7335_2648 [Synechococcus sp. PCC 7335]
MTAFIGRKLFNTVCSLIVQKSHSVCTRESDLAPMTAIK